MLALHGGAGLELDHRLVSAPYIRVADRTDLGGGVEIIKYDLRFCQPNQDHLDTKALHSVEHMMANFMRNYTDKLIGFAPMGCRTGFYVLLVGDHDADGFAPVLEATLRDLLAADEVLALENAWLAPLPPEGASLIVHGDVEHAADLARSQQVGAGAMARAGIVQGVVPEAGRSTEELARAVAAEVVGRLRSR